MKKLLAPSGISPWEHWAELTEDGRLVLYWKERGQERIRTFTQEETDTLADILCHERLSIQEGNQR